MSSVQGGSVHPDRQCGWAVDDQAERPCSANPSPHRPEELLAGSGRFADLYGRWLAGAA